jgi:serine/threonine protein phosphatase 1
MRILAIGDIHGCSGALRTLLAAVAPTPEDLLIALGDYVDRGLDSPGVLDLMIELHATGRLIALRGNHEQMMTDSRYDLSHRRGWCDCGGKETLEAYGIPAWRYLERVELPAIPEAHWEFLERALVDYHETDTHIFVHANLYPNAALEDQPGSMLLWESLRPEWTEPHCSGKVMVCGHTQQRSGLPLNLGHAICIDTCAYGSGWLTCLDVSSGKYWQANRDGQVRAGSLTEPS